LICFDGEGMEDCAIDQITRDRFEHPQVLPRHAVPMILESLQLESLSALTVWDLTRARKDGRMSDEEYKGESRAHVDALRELAQKLMAEKGLSRLEFLGRVHSAASVAS